MRILKKKKLDKKKIENALSNNDGSLRDINLQLGREDLDSFLDWYIKSYHVENVTNKNGSDVKLPLNKDYFDTEDMIFLNEAKAVQGLLIEGLNCHVIRMPEDVFDVELDFKPNNYSYDEFVSFLQQLLSRIKKKEFYVKYENVSWKYGDISNGVILSHNDINL